MSSKASLSRGVPHAFRNRYNIPPMIYTLREALIQDHLTPQKSIQVLHRLPPK